MTILNSFPFSDFKMLPIFLFNNTGYFDLRVYKDCVFNFHKSQIDPKILIIK